MLQRTKNTQRLQREHCENTGDNTERRQERPSEITLKKTLERTTHVGVHPRPLNVLTPCFLYVQPCFCREKYCRYIWVTSKRVIHNMYYWPSSQIYHLSTGSGKLPHGSHFSPVLFSMILVVIYLPKIKPYVEDLHKDLLSNGNHY